VQTPPAKRLSLRATAGRADSKLAVRLFRRELFSEINDDSVAILLTYGTARILFAGDVEAREEWMAGGSYSRSETLINVRKHKTT
jgi:beta-lactamase superfamily II metal-dependent hydrolase